VLLSGRGTMRRDDWNDLSPEDEDGVFDSDDLEDEEDEEPERSAATSEADEHPMTILRGLAGLALAGWLGWSGYQDGRIYGSVDRSRPQEIQVAYTHKEKGFWDNTAGLYGSFAGSAERIHLELFPEQATAFLRGDTATVYRSPGCGCFVTLQQVEASGPFHRTGKITWSWQGPAALALGLYSVLVLVMGGLGTLDALRGLSLNLRLIHAASVGIFAAVVAAFLGWGFWLATGYSVSAGALYSGVDPEKTSELTSTRAFAHHGWFKSAFTGEVRAPDGRALQVSLNKDEYLGLRVGDPLEVVLLDGGRKAETPRIVKGAQPTVRLFGLPFTWHIFLTPLGILLVLVFLALARHQVWRARSVLWLRRLWREEMERRYAGIDRVYWPDRQP